MQRRRFFHVVWNWANIRVIGTPYMYRGYYIVKCVNPFGRTAFCKVNPRTGAFIGISFRL